MKGINDGGKREQYGENGAMREPSTGKGRYDLISPFMLEELAKWLELGAAIFNIMAIIHFRKLGLLDDDNMPHYLEGK